MSIVSVPCRGTIFLNTSPHLRKRVRQVVSVPCRGTIFLNIESPAITSLKNVEFPSPVGELYFSICNNSLLSKMFVSVPCRGTIFLNLKSENIIINTSNQFPSPVGELYFSMGMDITTKEIFKVSVPCRGTIFLNHEK